jgi:hypothetical protein
VYTVLVTNGRYAAGLLHGVQNSGQLKAGHEVAASHWYRQGRHLGTCLQNPIRKILGKGWPVIANGPRNRGANLVSRGSLGRWLVEAQTRTPRVVPLGMCKTAVGVKLSVNAEAPISGLQASLMMPAKLGYHAWHTGAPVRSLSLVHVQPSSLHLCNLHMLYSDCLSPPLPLLSFSAHISNGIPRFPASSPITSLNSNLLSLLHCAHSHSGTLLRLSLNGFHS